MDKRRSGVGGGVWIGVSGRGGGERGQKGLVGWEGERLGIDRSGRAGDWGGGSGDRRKSGWERERVGIGVG